MDISISPDADTGRIVQFALDKGYTQEEAEAIHRYALGLTNFNAEYIMDKSFDSILNEWLDRRL